MMAAYIAREAVVALALAAAALWDARKREVARPALFVIALVGVCTPDRGFIIQSAVLFAAFCVWVAAAKKDIGFGGGDIWAVTALTFTVGLARALLSLCMGLLILIAFNKKRFGSINMKREVPLIPFIAAGYVTALIIITGGIVAKEYI
jgi:prepilin signal peptidase PulO-like enzyme (type II secretory pathway)